MSQLDTKDFSALIDYWWGRLVIAIGKGEGRDEMIRCIERVQREAFDRGIAWEKEQARKRDT